MKNFSLLLEALKKRNFYILGAGASYGLVSLTSEQGSKIIDRFIKYGSYSAYPLEIDNIGKRVLGPNLNNKNKFIQELISRIPNTAIYLTSAQLMAPKLHLLNEEQPQYSVFNLFPPRSIIFNFNVDGLAHHFCKYHYVLHPHRRLNAEKFQSALWNEIIEFSFDHADWKPKINLNILMPEPEPFGITRGIEYQKAFQLFRYSTYVVIIGYSFGYDGKSMDDWESFEFLKNLFLYYKVPIFIVDPYPEKLAYKLREDLKRNNVYEVTASWEILSKAIFELKRNRILHPHEKNKNLFDIYYLYCHLLNSSSLG